MKAHEYRYTQYVIVAKSKAPIFSDAGWDVVSDDPLLSIADARTERRTIQADHPEWDVKIIKETVVGKAVR